MNKIMTAASPLRSKKQIAGGISAAMGSNGRAHRLPRIVLTACLWFMAVSLAAQGQPAVLDSPAAWQGAAGFNLAFPAYFYERYSVAGIQGGFQFKKALVRLDACLANGYRNGQMMAFAVPSLSAFISQDWPMGFRTYQGASVGIEVGLLNAFQGADYFLNFVTGAEWFITSKKAFFLEIGSGLAYPYIEGAYPGGTVVGGGFKTYF
jgi:hypothetical protein